VSRLFLQAPPGSAKSRADSFEGTTQNPCNFIVIKALGLPKNQDQPFAFRKGIQQLLDVSGVFQGLQGIRPLALQKPILEAEAFPEGIEGERRGRGFSFSQKI